LLSKNLLNEIHKPNQYTLSAEAEILKIKELIKEIKFNINIELINRYPIINVTFEEYPPPYMIVIYDQKAKSI